MKRYFPYIIFTTAIFISVIAEYMSIIGISKVFSGGGLAVILLAIAIGSGKLVAVSAIQQYWTTLSKNAGGKTLRVYLALAAGILILVTSMGVYGYLAAAHQATADAELLVQSRLRLLKTKQDRFKMQSTELSSDSKSMAASLENLRKSLSTDNQYQSIDRRTGQILTQIQTTKKTGVQDQIDKLSIKKDDIDSRMYRMNDSIAAYDLYIIDAEANSKSTAELGPLRFVSNLTGFSMDKIVNVWMIFLILVIDPLAIALILIAQFAFKNDRWIRGVETRKKNKSRNALKSSTINDLDGGWTITRETVESPSPVMSEQTEGISKRKRGRPRGSGKKSVKSVDHFDVSIDPIADPDGTLIDRTVIESGLTVPTAEHLADSIASKKKV